MTMRPRKRQKGATSRKLRRQAKKIRVIDLYGEGVSGNLLQGRFGTPKIYAWFQNRHRRGIKQLEPGGVYRSGRHAWRIPPTVLLCIREPLSNSQMNNRLAWYVTWVSPRTGQRLRKYFMSPWVAMEFMATKAARVDPHAALVSRTRPYHIPAKFRGKMPYKQEHNGKMRTWYWCPLCMQPRRFHASRPEQFFYATVKVWSEEKQRFIPKERKLRLLECSYCECTNRETVFRSSNQPWEVRKFKRGARRARRRK
jgi:hypothetical protein